VTFVTTNILTGAIGSPKLLAHTPVEGEGRTVTSEERILRTLRGQPVDRVPHFEWLIDPHVVEALHPGADVEDLVEREGLDAFCVDLDYRAEAMGDGLLRDEWGPELHAVPVDGPIKSRKDLERYRPPDPADPARYRTLEAALRRHRGQRAVILHLNDALSIPSRLMSFQEFLVTAMTDPELAEDVIDLTVEVNLAMAAEARRRGVDVVYTGDDYAYNSGPMLSPELFRELILPRVRRVVAGYHALGLLVIKHTDGDIRTILDDIVEAGFDALDPIDPVAGMDLAEVKERVGRRLALKGNVDCANLLTFGTPREVRAASLRCLEIGSPGGRYVFSSSNSIHSTVRPENYGAMLAAWREFNGARA
jgi:uroporphyrinogen decarboxylase